MNNRLEKYQKEFESDIEVNMQNVKTKSMLISSIRAKWIRYYFIERNLLDKLKNAKSLYSKKIAKDISSKFATITANQDPKLEKINNEIKKSEYCIEFIDKAFNVLDTFNFQVKNVIDLIKLEVN